MESSKQNTKQVVGVCIGGGESDEDDSRFQMPPTSNTVQITCDQFGDDEDE